MADQRLNALQLADLLDDSRAAFGDCGDASKAKSAAELRRLHALSLELADQLSGSKDRIAELEAKQDRAPLALYQRDTIKANAWKETRDGGYYDANEIISATEAAHGITKDKQA